MLGQLTSLVILLGAAHAGVVLGGIEEGVGVGVVGHGVVDVHTPPRYAFKYGIEDPKTGDRKQQSEVRVNDVVKGEYSLVEPDGTVRVVKYTADDHNGFNAVVSRVGHAVHPQVYIRKAVVPIAHAVPVAHALPLTHAVSVAHTVPITTHGIAVGGYGGYGYGGILDGHDGLLDGRGVLDGGLLGQHIGGI